MKNIWVSSLVVLLAVAFVHTPCGDAQDATIYTITQIRSNTTATYGDGDSQINNQGQVVWSGYDETDYEIFLYDSKTQSTAQLTDNDYYSDRSPQINEQGQVVWAGNGVYLYDSKTQNTTQLTDNVNVAYPQINEQGQVVWAGEDGAYLYDSKSQITIQLGEQGGLVQINDQGQVVWSGYDGDDYEIFLYESKTQTTAQLTDNDYWDGWSQINNQGQVIWMGYVDSYDHEIFLYDSKAQTTVQLTDNDYVEYNPQINDQGQVVWYEAQGDDYEIFFYNGSRIIQLTDNDYWDFSPEINNHGQVVWSAVLWSIGDLTNDEIFLYDSKTQTTTQLTHNDYRDSGPQINDQGQVVWSGGYGVHGDVDQIFLANAVGSLYEDAEDGATAGWDIYDNRPAGARIANVYDEERGSRVIELSGAGVDNGYRLRDAKGGAWRNSHQSVIEWSMRYSERFTVYVDVQTSAGQRYLTYTPTAYSQLGSRRYVHHGLGTQARDGQWHTFTRNLAADLDEAQPGTSLLEVNGFLIRGSGRIDDVRLWSAEWTADPSLWVEAEAGHDIYPPMRVGTDPSEIRFIWVPPGNGNVTDPALAASARYDFSVPVAGNYVIWARTLAPHEGANSFFVSLDEEDYWAYHIPISSDWVWQRVGAVYFAAGSHSLSIKHREQGTRLDKILLTLNPNYVP